jgi:hypothetical protein
MDEKTKTEYEAKSKELRASLKKWESEWAGSHQGSKPGRQDIKNNPEIGTEGTASRIRLSVKNADISVAQKYKDYNKTRDILSGKIPVPTKEAPIPKKRKPDPPPSETPFKKPKVTETPSKNRLQDEEYMNTPAISRKLFSPAAVTSLGPTPQRDGRVLGLFDLLVDKELNTPTKKSEQAQKIEARPNVQSTPSKRRGSLSEDASLRLSRTPMSSSKRQMLNTFMTPLKKRDDNVGGKTPTPRSVSKLQFETPAFLRRHTLPSLQEDTTFDAPAPLKLPRKPLGRGLSEIVASLRKVEEDKLDDDLEALREAESEEMGGPPPSRPAEAPKDDKLAKDSQTQRLPLGGFDDEAMYDSPVEEPGAPTTLFKKKGQKRTTRLVKMKPIISKRPSQLDQQPPGEEVIPETQIASSTNDAAYADMSDASGSDFGDGGATAKPKTAPQKDGTVKKTARKVNELAHANFRRLKLRSKVPKGRGGFKSKFRRR